MKQKRWFKTATCLLVGIVVLTAAVFANYDNASSYSVCKNAAKDFLYQTNYSMKYQVKVMLDDTELMGTEMVYQVNGGGNPKRYRKQTGTDFENRISVNEEIQQDKLIISLNQYYTGEVYNMAQADYRPDRDSGALMQELGDTGDKLINFMEALCDTFVGDLKNNFVLVDSQDGNRTYCIDLMGNQMPEVVTAGVSLIVQNLKESMEDQVENDDGASTLLWNSMFQNGEPYIHSVSGRMTVNAQGLPIMAKGVADIYGVDVNGTAHVLTVHIAGEAYDYGTTEIEKMDLDSIPNLDYSSRGSMTMQINTRASAEENNAVIARAEEMAAQGYAVHIVNENGKNVIVIHPPFMTEAAEETIAE